jgi:hypothetical protein
MVGIFASAAPAYAALTLIVVTGAVVLVWLISRLGIQPRPDDEPDEGDGPGGGGGGGGTGNGAGGPGRGGLETEPGSEPVEPEWWPEFERRLAEYSSSRARPVRRG